MKRSTTRRIFECEDVDDEELTPQKLMQEDKALQLDFTLEHYFLLGSPLGVFISVYNEEDFIKDKLPTCANFYNIFHPHDVVAYRVEPLFKSPDSNLSYEKLPPVLLPYYKNNGYHALNSIGQFIKESSNNFVSQAWSQLDSLKKQYIPEKLSSSLTATSATQSEQTGDDPTFTTQGSINQNNKNSIASDNRFDFCL